MRNCASQFDALHRPGMTASGRTFQLTHAIVDWHRDRRQNRLQRDDLREQRRVAAHLAGQHVGTSSRVQGCQQ
jgi:hypothetical protein